MIMESSERPVTEIYLQPGQYLIAGPACRIRTLLGSCVSIVLWHPQRKVGAMSHCLLPSRGSLKRHSKHDARYLDEAFYLMLRELLELDVPLAHCQAKVFGGGNMFPQHARSDQMHIGRKNGDMARALLEEADVPMVSEHLFGVGYRNIVFDIDSGDVWVRQVDCKPGMDISGQEICPR